MRTVCRFNYTIPAQTRTVDLSQIQDIPLLQVMRVLAAAGMELKIKPVKRKED